MASTLPSVSATFYLLVLRKIVKPIHVILFNFYRGGGGGALNSYLIRYVHVYLLMLKLTAPI